MKAITLIMVFCLTGIQAWAQEIEERTVDSFDEIEVGEAIEVYLTHGRQAGVRVEASGVETNKVITEVSGETLEIHMEKGNYSDNEVKVYVTYQALERIQCTSAAAIYGKSTIEGDELTIRANSAGKADLDVEVESLEISVSSSGKLELTGTAENLKAKVTGAGKLDAYGLSSDNTTINVNSGGKARVVANNKLSAEANSGGKIQYKGNPDQRNTNTNSGGAIKAE